MPDVATHVAKHMNNKYIIENFVATLVAGMIQDSEKTSSLVRSRRWYSSRKGSER